MFLTYKERAERNLRIRKKHIEKFKDSFGYDESKGHRIRVQFATSPPEDLRWSQTMTAEQLLEFYPERLLDMEAVTTDLGAPDGKPFEPKRWPCRNSK
tara:strand:- start:98894 stop:99187 length:294 start_codon:yes stop_codon:yes gene_type:complete